MSLKTTRDKNIVFFKGLPLFLVIMGGLFLLFTLWFWERGIFQILPGVFAESVNVPLDYIQLGLEIFPMQAENFILLQSFESLPPLTFPKLSLLWGVITWILLTLTSSLISTFKRTPFIIGMAVWMALLSISGINSLNIGGIYSNYALIILLIGWVAPLIFINFYQNHWSLLQRFAFVFSSATLTLIGLVFFSDMPAAALLVAENLTLPALALAAFFLLHIGHAIFSGVTIFLIKLNKGTQLKISYHLVVIFIVYFLLVFSTLLDTLGEINLPIPTIPPYLLFVLAGVIGYFVYQEKIKQTPQPFEQPIVGQSLYLSFFGITLWTWGKAVFVENQPYIEFFNHVFLYGQVAFTLLFFAYLLANFLDILNSGKDVEKIIFKPQHFAYFHMRIGGIMGLAILIVFGNTIIINHIISGSTNQAADYYYHAEMPKQAAILYESAWMQFRKNDKAKNAAVHLRLLEGNKREALEQLEQSMDFNPNVPNLLLISKLLHEQDKVFEAVFYLDKGLKIFPDNPYLLNNLALLQSKLNKPSEAIEKLDQFKDKNPVFEANWIGLNVKHQREHQGLQATFLNPLSKINQLAHDNRLGNSWEGALTLQDFSGNFIVQTAAIRNLWTNRPHESLTKDLALIDTLITTTEITFRERNLRDSRVIRLYQAKEIGETLKYLIGNSEIFSNSAGYYHLWSALVLAGQLDLEKAAIDILVAEERGVIDFKPHHLAILYFGGKPIEAIRINQKFTIPFPYWMTWGEDGKLEQNPQLQYFEALKNFHTKLEDELMSDLQSIEQDYLQASFATNVLIYKAHLLSTASIESIKTVLQKDTTFPLQAAAVEDWMAYIRGEKTEIDATNSLGQLLNPESGLTRNPYWVPLVLKSLANTSDEVDKYNILQDAKQFSKDPILWIAYIRQARKIGLDFYATDALQQIYEWVERAEVERLLSKSVN
ncbi:tetratricopeptide repeat protein [Mongoliitalea daihaiensis]|uniref:tetratricopeptide repeat protein n=1 Tax=Mongoliitalea daihaiensis TaxID=2782006 RepID=UPI001F419DCA|nr:hypothetical protein [Mongoliitalea daihaiensis]UJP64769.1 hypothetical protein IPZ59_18565 [Mongoliitalea daihaiensis]